MTENTTLKKMRSDLLILYNAISDGVIKRSPILEKMIFELNEKIGQVERLQKIVNFPHGTSHRRGVKGHLKRVA